MVFQITMLHFKAILGRANEMSFVMNHAPGAGLIARAVDLQSSEAPLYYECPLVLLFLFSPLSYKEIKCEDYEYKIQPTAAL